MKHRTNSRITAAENLSVSYKAPDLFASSATESSDFIIITDRQFNVTGWSPATENIFEKKIKDAKGKSFFLKLNISFPDISPEDMLAKLRQDGFWSGKIVYERFDMRRLYFTVSGMLIYDDAKKESGCVFVLKSTDEAGLHQKKLIGSESKYQIVIDTLFEGVIMISSSGVIEACNNRAAEILGLPESALAGQDAGNLKWNAIREDGTVFPADEFPANFTLRTSRAQESVTMGIRQPEGKICWLLMNSQPIIENGQITAVVASFNDITGIKYANDRVKESEALFRTFMNNSQAYAWICDEDGYLIYFNSLFGNTFRLSETASYKHITEVFSLQTAEDFLKSNKKFLDSGNPAFIIVNAERPDNMPGKFALYRFNIPVNSYKRLIGFQAFDITEQQNTVTALQKTNDRLFHIANATSDAIWDQDLETNEIYRSPNFSKLSGYSMEEIHSDLDWWFTKVHPDDKVRVQEKVVGYMNSHKINWEDEYRFLCADGTYKTFYDKGFFMYRDGKPVRIIGAIQDITERKKLEEQLLNEKIKQQRVINKTTVEAQEKERDNISKELHDNVNQLLMSTKLFINMARKQPERAADLLTKAEEYQLMAVEEIRKLSKKLSSSLVKVLGLEKSIREIVTTFQEVDEIAVNFEFDNELENLMMGELKLIVFRIVQEQTNNIRKYAGAGKVYISLTRKNDNRVHLIISDDGVGFKKDELKNHGIGLTNIASRINVLNGEYRIDSYPGNGCTLTAGFPLYS